MSISILTLSWNGADKLKNLAEGLLPILEKMNAVWLIKDNGSTDDSVKLVESWGHKNVHLEKYPDNKQNFSEGVNFLFEKSKQYNKKFTLLLNNDVIIKNPDSFSNMISIFSDGSVGAVGAKLLYPTTNIQHVGVVFDDTYKFPTHYKTNEVLSRDENVDREFQAVTGAVLMLRTSDFEKLNKNKSGKNGMCEDFHWAFDDVDLCLSMKYNLGKKIIYCSNTEFIHEESATLKKNPLNKLFMNHNFQLLLSKWSTKIVGDHSLYKKNKKHNIYKAKNAK